MKIVNILGGIGNQMFQYAFLVALRGRTGTEVCYDASVFKTYPVHNGFELDRRFCITARQATAKEVRKLTFYTESYFWWKILTRFHVGKTVHERGYTVYSPEVLEDKSDKYYYGYWQHLGYFGAYRDVLRKEFEWKEPLDAKNRMVYEDFAKGNTVSIHIRRGDYLKNWLYKDICELDYYAKAIEYVKRTCGEGMKFAIFSNDMKWCEDNIVPLLEGAHCTMVDWNQGAASYNDMRLMQACRVNIIANSSFSWWAAYLNVHADAMVVAPKVWINEDKDFRPQLDDWHLIQ